MKLVQTTLGHSQISLTMDAYSHVSAVMQAEAAPLMDNAVRKRA
jgi:integrase